MKTSHEEIRRDAIAAAERIGDVAIAPSFPWTDQTSEAEENRVQLALAKHRASRDRVMGTETPLDDHDLRKEAGPNDPDHIASVRIENA